MFTIRNTRYRARDKGVYQGIGNYTLAIFLSFGMLLSLVTINATHADSRELSVINVTAESAQYPHVPENTLDGDFGTRWSAEGIGQTIVFELSELSRIDNVEMAWFKGDERTASFSIQVSQTGGDHWTFVANNISSGDRIGFESTPVRATFVRFVRIVGFGNSQNDWNSITGVKIFGQEMNLPPAPSARIQSITASSARAPHLPANTVDDDLSNRWSAKGFGESITYELYRDTAVNQVRIAWFKGDERFAYLGIEVSLNGLNWKEVFRESSGGRTKQLETYAFPPVPARYVRIVGYGNSTNDWTSITEVSIRGPRLSMSQVDVDAVSAQESRAPHVAENTIDSDLGTRWSSPGPVSVITFELNDITRLSRVDIAWFKGDQREAFVLIEVTDQNGVQHTVFNGDSSGTTRSPEPYVFSEIAAQSVRIYGYGNTSNNWTSITEVAFYTIDD